MKSPGSAVRLVIPALVFISLLVACGSGSSSGGVDVEMKDFLFEPTELTFQSDTPVTIELINRGDVEHDMVIVSEVFDFSFEALEAIAARPEIVVGRVDRVAPGGSASIDVTFAESGDYQFFCTIFGHFFQGMRGTISVGA